MQALVLYGAPSQETAFELGAYTLLSLNAESSKDQAINVWKIGHPTGVGQRPQGKPMAPQTSPEETVLVGRAKGVRGMKFLQRRSRETTVSGESPSSAWALPSAPRHLYMPDELPSTDVARMYDVEWLNKQMQSGTAACSFEQANVILRGHPKEDRISSVTLALTKHVQSLMSVTAVAEAIETDLFYAIWLGIGFGLLEERSGQRLPDVLHPSIWNGMVLAGTLGASETEVPQDVRYVVTKAREGGYSAQRHHFLTPGEVFARCDFGL